MAKPRKKPRTFLIVEVDPTNSSTALDILRMWKATMEGSSTPDLTKGLWWIAFENDKPVAFAAIKQAYNHQDTAYMTCCGVLAKARGQGLQRQLIAMRVVAAERLGSKAVITYTIPSNNHSMNNLIQEGFTTFQPAVRWAGCNVVYWRKQIV